MPPVRWKLSAVTVMCLLQMVLAESQFRQEGMSMDGWKPIVGVSTMGTRKPHFYDPPPPNGGGDPYGGHSTPPPPQSLGPTVTGGPSRPPPFYRGSPKPPFMGGRKVLHQKYSHPDPFYALQARDNHGPHIPINAVIQSRPGQIGQLKQLATTGRPMILLSTTMKRKRKTSIRIPSSTGGYRDELFTASASSSPYNHYRPGGPIRTRETVDLGLPGANHYSINQPHSHIEFSRFSLAPGTVYRQYNNPSVPSYIFKHPHANDIDYPRDEEYNRFYKGQGKHENAPHLQVPPPFQYTQQKINEPPVHVQVTKEKINEYHNNAPANYHGQYIEYDFSNNARPDNGKYEVTEGVWQDAPGRSRPVNQEPQKAPPSQSSVYEEPEEDVPAFLPTPYKPEKQGVEPTSPTQSDVSTIFTKLSQRVAATTPNPFSYSVKEVSTHFPIFGRPVFGEAPNEIPTTSDPSRRPQRRRKPPTTTTTVDSKIVDDQLTSPQRSRPTEPRGRNKYAQELSQDLYEPRKRQRVTSTTMPGNHKSEEEFHEESRRPVEHDEAASEHSEEVEDSPDVELELPREKLKPLVLTTTQRSTTEPTTTSPPTTTPPRIKVRVNKFDNSNRPRFSIKDYPKSTQSTTTTPKPSKATGTRKVRLPHRKRTTTTTPPSTDEEGDAPKKDPTEASDTGIITMKNVKSVNTRLRPFGRYMSTPATTTAPKVSIKSNLFSRKRPAMLSLRNKIFNKYHKNSTEATTERVITTTEESDEPVESATVRVATEANLEVDDDDGARDVSRDDPYFYSQMVSDLTSSTKNDYNTFKSVSPKSRRIPNYFTMTTDDPVLPLEAFFSSIKETGREEES